MKYKSSKKMFVIYFVIFVLVLFLNCNVVYAACYRCNQNGYLTCDKSSYSCPSGWATSNSCECPSSCRPSSCANKVSYTATFNANGGSPTVSKTCWKGSLGCYISNPTNPSRSGFYFVGWSRQSGSSNACDTTSVNTNLTGNITYYAAWANERCWDCKNGTSHLYYKKSASQPAANLCSSSSWVTANNPTGTGFWVETNYSNCCGSSSGTPTIPEPEPGKDPGPEKDPEPEIENFCKVDKPDDSELNCNDTKTLESTCDKRTIVIKDVGYADVKIEQKGYISSVLTPDRTYAGAGFSFGVTYTNTVKWSYVGTAATGSLHKAITTEMNNKLKDYDSYIAGLKISELKFAGKNRDDFLVKKCYTSSTSIDYYKKELTVSCTFYLPDSVIKNNGNVDYTAGIGTSITNKYYTPINYSGNYKISAKIVGMSRIKDASKDGVKGKSWTGTWSDTFEDCSIDLYPLLYKDGTNTSNGGKKYNFIYRPIDPFNPFPNRNAGINWFEWYSLNSNKERLESTYDSDNLQYTTVLDNETISSIKNYNEEHNYFAWEGSYVNDEWRSSFIDDYDYVERNGG